MKVKRVIDRQMAKVMKKDGEKKYSSLKKIGLSDFIKKINSNIKADSLPVVEINNFALLAKTLELSKYVKSILLENEGINANIDKKINTFDKADELFGIALTNPRYLGYGNVLLKAKERLELILESVNGSFKSERLESFDTSLKLIMVNDIYIPFLIVSLKYFIDIYEDENIIFDPYFKERDNSSALKELKDELNSIITLSIAKRQNKSILDRLLNINHDYTGYTIKKISMEINEEISKIFEIPAYREKDQEISAAASKHFYRILEIKSTFLALYPVEITRDDLKQLFRICYYYQFYKVKADGVYIPEDIKIFIDRIDTLSVIDIAKMDIDAVKILEYRDNNIEMLYYIIATAKLDVPVTAYILDSAVEQVIKDAEGKIEVELFKQKVKQATKDILKFINSEYCNALYRATYSVDINNTVEYLDKINSDDENWWHKILKTNNIFKINKIHIAI